MTAGTAHELKGLQTQRDRLQIDIKQIRGQQSELGKQATAKEQQLAGVLGRIKALETAATGVIVTEHAILRFLERVDLIDMETVKKRILPAAIEAAILEMGSGTYPVGTHKVVVKHSSVVSVLEAL